MRAYDWSPFGRQGSGLGHRAGGDPGGPPALKLADKTGIPGDGGTRLGLQLTRQDIADIVGCTLETAIRILSRWQKEGLIKTQEGVITILNRQELGRLLGPG